MRRLRSDVPHQYPDSDPGKDSGCIDAHIAEFAAAARHKTLVDLIRHSIYDTAHPGRNPPPQEILSAAAALRHPEAVCKEHDAKTKDQIFRKMRDLPHDKRSCIHIQPKNPYHNFRKKGTFLIRHICRHSRMDENKHHHQQCRHQAPDFNKMIMRFDCHSVAFW